MMSITMRVFSAALLLLSFMSVTHGELLKKFMMGNMNDKGNSRSASSPENNEPPAAAMTCDAMMAKSLVAANEATATAEAERDQFFHDLESMTLSKEQLEMELKETTHDLTQRLFSANEQTAKVTKEGKEALEKLDEKWKAEMQEMNNNMALLRDRSERAIYETQQDSARRIKLQKEEFDKAIQAKNDELASMKEHYDQQAAALREEAAANITTVVSQSSAVTASLKEEHAQHVKLLQEEMKLHEEKHNELLEAMKTEVTETIRKMEDDHKKSLSEMEAEYTAKLDKANAEIKDLQQQLKTVEKQRSKLEKDYNAASEEVSRWEQLYGSRSYCNFTYIQEDTVAAAVATQKAITNEAAKVVDKATKATQKLVETSVKKAEPHVKKARALIYENVQPHVDKTHDYYKEHMKPHVDKHITPYAAPLWKELSIILKEGWAEAKQLSREAHDQLVSLYKGTCPGTLKRLEEMEHAPTSMVDHVKKSCREPEKTVDTFLWTFLCIFVFVFRSFLWRTFVVRPVSIVWFLSPLRLVFGKRKVESSAEEEMSEDETPVASPIKSESTKKVPPQ